MGASATHPAAATTSSPALTTLLVADPAASGAGADVRPRRCWIAVVSREHVRRGAAGGFVQVCHGQAGPLRRMGAGDLLAFYSPTEALGGGGACRRFTALAVVDDGAPYAVDLGGGFVPHRRNVTFVPVTEADVAPLVPALSFLPDKRRWGFPFRRGHFEIPAADMASIAAAMESDLVSDPASDLVVPVARDG